MGAAWFDYDNDGLLDLVVANYTTWTPQTDRRCSVNGRGVLLQPDVLPAACRTGCITTWATAGSRT